MNKSLTLTMIMYLLASTVTANNGTWTKKASISIARSTHFVFTINNKAYVGCGIDANNRDLKDLWEYNPVNNTWSQKADFAGGERREMSAFSVGDYGYAGQGRNTSSGIVYSNYFKYNPTTNSWSSIADCPVERYANTGFRIDSIGYVYGGILPGVARYRDLYAYNPRTNKWTSKQGRSNNSPSSSYAKTIEFKGTAFLVGGFDGNSTDEFEEYNPITNKWTVKSSYPSGVRNDVAGFAIGDLIYIGMGRNSSTTTFKDWYIYNPVNDSWTSTTDYPEDNSAGNVSFVINGKGYVCAGNNLGGTRRNYLYELSFQTSSIISLNSNAKHKISVFQNEGTNNVNVISDYQNVTIRVIDMNGKVVFNSKINMTEINSNSISLNHLPSGQYVFQAFNNIELTSKKIIIMK